MKKVLSLMLSMLLLAGVLAGCSSSGGSDGQGESSTPPASTTTTPEAPSTRTITDMAGVKVEIPAEVHTYVETWFAHNAVDVMLVNAEGMLVTCNPKEDNGWMYLVSNDLQGAKYSEFSEGMNLEEIIALQPDVVFGSSENYRKMFNEVGIPYINCMFSTYDQMRQSISMTAEVLGEEAQAVADQYLAYLDEKISFVADTVSVIDAADRKTVAHGNAISTMSIDGANTIIDEWIKLAGGVNAAADEVSGNMQAVTIEQLLAWDPDVIITGGTQDEVDSILADPVWQALTAVQNGEVYANPKGVFSWDRYGVEEALQFQWAAKTLYPELFADYSIEDEVIQFYKDFFRYDLTDEQVAKIINHEDP